MSGLVDGGFEPSLRRGSDSGRAREKIFGIGLQRTATSSLAEACRILGWNPCHGDYARLPGALDLNDPIYETFNMFCDTPFYYLFEKLDFKYPGSKFILTVREEDSWIESVQKLFNVNRQFSYSPAIRLHHTLVYGSPSFDESAMRDAHRRHIRKVSAHFQDRQADLLIADLTRNAGWNELCEFLGCERPSCPFPHLNRI
jgi:hypothetical protein